MALRLPPDLSITGVMRAQMIGFIGVCALTGALACGGTSGKGSPDGGSGGNTGGDDPVVLLGTASRLTSVASSGSILLAVGDDEEVLRSVGGSGAGSWRPSAPALYIGNTTRVIWDGRRFVTIDRFGSVFTTSDGSSDRKSVV